MKVAVLLLSGYTPSSCYTKPSPWTIYYCLLLVVAATSPPDIATCCSPSSAPGIPSFCVTGSQKSGALTGASWVRRFPQWVDTNSDCVTPQELDYTASKLSCRTFLTLRQVLSYFPNLPSFPLSGFDQSDNMRSPNHSRSPDTPTGKKPCLQTTPQGI